MKDVQIGQRMITISTVGVPNTIRKLASHKLQSTLAVRYANYNKKFLVDSSAYHLMLLFACEQKSVFVEAYIFN